MSDNLSPADRQAAHLATFGTPAKAVTRYALHDAIGEVWSAGWRPSTDCIRAFLAAFPRLTLYRNDVPLAVFRGSALASVCAWCPDARERTIATVAEGFQVTHGICEPCQGRFEEGL